MRTRKVVEEVIRGVFLCVMIVDRSIWDAKKVIDSLLLFLKINFGRLKSSKRSNFFHVYIFLQPTNSIEISPNLRFS